MHAARLTRSPYIQPLDKNMAQPGTRKAWQEHQDRRRTEFRISARSITFRHLAQTEDQVAALERRYARPVFGVVKVWDLVQQLAACVDPADVDLYNTSQLVHVLQVLESMEDDGVSDPQLQLAAILHDLGKLLLLADEAPENVVSINRPIGSYSPGVGLENVTFCWNHDEFAYSRFKDYLPAHLSWLIRYHSIDIDASRPYMNALDHERVEQYLIPFRQHDLGSKSPYHLPKLRLEAYRDLVEDAFPDPIPF
jgi:hypothetical protein